MENAILQYNFFPHCYTSNKDVYEPILCECLNKSKKDGGFMWRNFFAYKEPM